MRDKTAVFSLLGLLLSLQAHALGSSRPSSALNSLSSNSDTAPTEESTCSAVDLRTPELGHPESQDLTGWCSFFSSAAALSLKIHQHVSPQALAYEFFRSQGLVDDLLNIFRPVSLPKQHYSGNGEPVSTMDFARGKNVCIEKPSLMAITKSNWDEPRNFTDFQRLIYVYSSTSGRVASIRSDLEYQTASVHNDEVGSIPASCYQDPKCLDAVMNVDNAVVYGGLTFSEVRAILDKSNDTNVDDNILRAEMKKGCDWSVVPDDLAVENKNNNPRDPSRSLFDKIDSLLDAKTAVIIDYNMGPFVDENNCNNGLLKPIVDKSKEQGHSSIIVGRQFKDGQCQYLIRNSYGATCDACYSDKAHCETTDPGNFWATESDLKASIMGIVWLK